MSPESSTAAGTPAADQVIRRALPRTPHEGIAFVQPLHAGSHGTFRVELVDLNSRGAGVRILSPCPRTSLSS